MDDFKSIADLVKIAKRQWSFRGIEIADNDTDIIEDEVKRAIREINRCRRFEPTTEQPYPLKYEDLIIPLCVSAFAKIGAEGQTSHSENGISRNYTSGGDYPKDLLEEIVPLIK